MSTADLSTPDKAREHAHSQAGTVILAMPTIPASAARNLPPNVTPADVVWDETIAGGEYCARVLERGTRLRLTNLDGDGCISLLVFNADHPIERLNVADTVKVQWNAYLGKGRLLLSDMGRVLLSIVDDTSGVHDTFCGASTEKSNARKYGQGANHTPCPAARDRFLLALAKYGLGRKDIPANINFFKGVKIDLDGGINFIERKAAPGEFIEFRAEMKALVALANTPHVLDPRPAYTCTAVRVTAWRGPIAGPDDAVRNSSPEALRAFQNVEDYYTT